MAPRDVDLAPSTSFIADSQLPDDALPWGWGWGIGDDDDPLLPDGSVDLDDWPGQYGAARLGIP